MKTAEQIIYVPVFVEEVKRPKWDPFLFNDTVESDFFETKPSELLPGVGFYVGEFSIQNDISAVRGELDAIISSEAISEVESFETASGTISGNEIDGADFGSSGFDTESGEGGEGGNDGGEPE